MPYSEFSCIHPYTYTFFDRGVSMNFRLPPSIYVCLFSFFHKENTIYFCFSSIESLPVYFFIIVYLLRCMFTCRTTLLARRILFAFFPHHMRYSSLYTSFFLLGSSITRHKVVCTGENAYGTMTCLYLRSATVWRSIQIRPCRVYIVGVLVRGGHSR